MEQSLILPDTNILILGLMGKPPYSPQLSNWIKSGRIVLSVITISEFLSKSSSEEEALLSSLYDQIPILDIDLATAQLAAHFRKTYYRQRIKLNLPDCLIAAQCKLGNFTLATLNSKDFNIIPEISIIDHFEQSF